MIQISDIITTINRLQSTVYHPDRDNEELLGLYKTIFEIVNDRESFVDRSAGMVNALSESRLNEEEKQRWLNYAASIFASFLAVKLYEDNVNDQNMLSAGELDQVLDFYMEGNFRSEVTSIGIYSCAQQMNETDPMRCFGLTKTAFTIYPNLASILNIEYRYEGMAAEEQLTKECPFCGSHGDSLIPYYCSPQVLKLDNNHVFPPAKLWMKCQRCGNYFTYNFPKSNVGTINGHYTAERGSSILTNKFNLDNYNPIFNRFKSLTSGLEYLEIGVGTGEMLAVAQEFGYHVDAVEICREDCERISQALNVDIKWCDITDHETEKKYDVIVMGDVLEHVIHPVEVLKKVRRMLAEEGVLWISTPNFNCAYARMQKFAHCMWHELNHYTYVSYETLNRLLNSMQMEIVHYDMSSRYIGSMEVFIRHKK